jgi:AcrR family transcriptional regulator
MARAPAVSVRRRRRSPDEAEREILDAAERLLKKHPLHEVTVRAVMAETTLSRNSFYVYFRDRYDLIGRLVTRLRTEANAALRLFADRGSDPSTAGHRALEAVARLYTQHGPILRALQQAARTDPRAARAWNRFTSPAFDAVMTRVREEIETGRTADPDPEAIVQALLTMTRACLLELEDPSDEELARMVDTLDRIWGRAVFPEP